MHDNMISGRYNLNSSFSLRSFVCCVQFCSRSFIDRWRNTQKDDSIGRVINNYVPLTEYFILSLNRLMEVPNDEVDGELRWKRFDATFCLLLHTYYTVNRMVR